MATFRTYNRNPVTGSLVGKHDYQLQKEMDAVLKERSITAYSSFERRRGRVGLIVDVDHIAQAEAAFLELHPDFVFSMENPAQGRTHFRYFSQIITQ